MPRCPAGRARNQFVNMLDCKCREHDPNARDGAHTNVNIAINNRKRSKTEGQDCAAPDQASVRRHSREDRAGALECCHASLLDLAKSAALADVVKAIALDHEMMKGLLFRADDCKAMICGH